MSKNKNENPYLTRTLQVLIASGIGIALFFMLLGGSSLWILKADLPESFSKILALCSLWIPCFLSGLISAKLIHKKGFIFGAVSVLPIDLVLLSLCAAFYGSVQMTYVIGILLGILLGALGGICGMNMRRKRKYR